MKHHRTTVIGIIRSIVSRLTEISYPRLGLMYALTIVGFACIYFALATLTPEHGPGLGGGPSLIRFLNAIYFSIVTATSVGYGDITPHGISKIVASIEIVLSLFVFAILVYKPVSEKQEIALYQMHKLTFDEIFTTIREGFYVMRKDFDAMMEEIRTTKTLSEYGRNNFETALHHGEVLMGDIPRFYNIEERLYTIDIRREKLLAEGVARTFDRLSETVTVIAENKIVCTEKTPETLRELVAISTKALQRWRLHASKTIHPLIDRSSALLEQIGRVELS